MWPARKLCDLIGIDVPIVQAPMAGASGAALAIAVSEAGGLGSLPCAMLSPQRARDEIMLIKQATSSSLPAWSESIGLATRVIARKMAENVLVVA